MKTIKVFLVVLLVGLLGCSDDSLVNILADEEEATGLEMILEDQSILAPGKHLPPGQVEPVLSFPADESPEGIILDNQGNIYVGVRHDTETSVESKILKITPGGTVSVFAVMPVGAAGANGVLGLGVDPSGNLYAALSSEDPASHGVWRIRRNGGAMERLAGSEAIILPNAMIFDNRGNLYVTDSFGGAVWRYGKDKQFSLWIQDDLLAELPIDPFPFRGPGANGIAFEAPNTLYVANTEQGLVARILIAPDGSAASINLVAGGGPTSPLTAVDGIVVDGQGYIYGVLPPSTLEEIGAPPLPPLVKLDPNTGEVTAVVTDASAFDTPVSLAFGRGRRDHKSVFIVNSALAGPGLGAGPNVLQVGVEGAGFPRRIVGLGADDTRIPFTGEITAIPDPDAGSIVCADAGGLTLSRKDNVTGRVYYLDEVTGYLAATACRAQPDGSLASEGDWRFIGAGGHMIMGTWTATTLADNSFTGRTVITDGIGQFVGATGWTRFSGQMDSATGMSEFTGSGLISPPKDVRALGITTEINGTALMDRIFCVDRDGDATGETGTKRFEGVGLSTYLGEVRAVVINERCIDERGVSTFYGTWSYTGARGDAIRGTHVVKIGVGEPWPNDLIITGGEGRFEGVTGRMDGLVYWDDGYSTEEGVIFLPR